MASKLSKDAEKIVKRMVLLFLISIILYIIYMNVRPLLIPIKYDFGLEVGENINNGISIVSPNRMSITKESEGIKYQELKSNFVYSDIEIPINTRSILMKVRFKNNFPLDSDGLYIGLKNAENWSYVFFPLFLPKYEQFVKNFPYIRDGRQTLFFLKTNSKKFDSIQDFLDNIPKGSVIATNSNISTKYTILNNMQSGNLDISKDIRGNSSFYIYAAGNIQIDITKQDLNTSNNEDIANITVFNESNTILYHSTILDDGDIKASNIKGKIQFKKIVIPNNKKGIFKLDIITNNDILITNFKVNQKYIVVKGNIWMLSKNKLYTRTFMDRPVLNEVNYPFSKKDKLLNESKYFSFTEDAYFEPFEYEVVPYSNTKQANYLLVEYNIPIKDNDWMIGSVEFDMRNLYVKNSKLSFVINAKHLSDAKYLYYSIPIDWIDATILANPYK